MAVSILHRPYPLILVMLLGIAGCAQQEPSPQQGTFPAASATLNPQPITQPAGEPVKGSPMAEIQNSFQASGRPVLRNMAGSWIMTKSVSPDHVETNLKGIRPEDSPAEPYDWVLTFFVTAGEQLRVISVEGNAHGEMSEAVLGPEGDLTFHAGDGGNYGRKEYRCRSSNPTQLVCLWSGHETETGAEFRKSSN